MADTDHEIRLQELMAEVRRHRDALLEFRQSAYPEMVEQHELQLEELYTRIRQHCAKHRLAVPASIPSEAS